MAGTGGVLGDVEQERSVTGVSARVALVTSTVSAIVSLFMLHRALRGADVQVDWLLLGVVRDLPAVESCYLAVVGVACGWAVRRRNPAALGTIQLYALAVGAWLAQRFWGEEPGPMVDHRALNALLAGAATLHACYLCLIAHAVVALRGRRRGRGS